MKEHDLDARHLLCPLPVIRLQQKIAQSNAGDLIHIVFTDPGGQYDIPAWCRVHGHKILESLPQERDFHMTIEIVADASD